MQQTSVKDKSFWAVYLNMARHNACHVIRYIEKVVTRKDTGIAEEGLINCKVIENLIEQGGNAADIQATIRLLDKHFPFLRYMMEHQIQLKGENTDDNGWQSKVTPEDYYFVLETVLNLLNSLRNYYTHIIHEDCNVNLRVFRFLELTFDASVRVVKDRFWKDDPKTGDRNVEHLKRADRNGLKQNFRYNFRSEDGHLTENGLAYFTCLFLEKKYAVLMLKQLSGFKADQEQWQRATLETYSALRLVFPKERLDSTEELKSMGLDILNEIQKCPEELFDLLSARDQERFRIQPDDENEESPSVLLKRYGDRFPYFALRYIDEKELFKDFRFHIDLGTYYFDRYQKSLYDGTTQDRYLSMRLKGFGRIQEMNEKYREELENRSELFYPNQGESSKYRMPTYPHYHFNSPLDSIIGIRENDDYPQIDPDQRKVNTQRPDIWLSVYEIPAMLFLAYLSERKNNSRNPGSAKLNEAENVLRMYKSKMTTLLRKIRDNDTDIQDFIDRFVRKERSGDDFYEKFKIRLSYLPDDLKDYLTGKKITGNRNGYAERLARWYITDSEERINKIVRIREKIKEDKYKPGKRKYPEIKSGTLASFLAEDIVRLQPSAQEGRNKLTTPNFRSLQAHIAFWNREEDRRVTMQILQQSGLTGKASANRHPFLDKMGDLSAYMNIADLYVAYCENRKKYFQECLAKGKLGVYALKNNRLERKEKDGDQYFRDLAGKLLELPFNFPRGLFQEKLIEFIRKNGDNTEKEIIKAERVNTVFIIRKYFEIKRTDASQPFYGFPRHYKFWDRLLGCKTGKMQKYPDVFMTCEDGRISQLKDCIDRLSKDSTSEGKLEYEKIQRAYTHFKKNEKLLRLYKAQDMLLWLLAEDLLLSDQMEYEDPPKLYNAVPGNDKSILEKEVSISLTVSGKKIHQNVLRIKNYGDFRRFIQDRRMPELLKWCTDNTIEREILEKEFEQYEQYRFLAFQKIHEFENLMNQKYPQEVQQEVKNGYADFEGILSVFYQHIMHSSAEVKNDMVLKVRNAFSHNQYPNTDILKGNKPEIKNGVISTVFGEFEKQLKEYTSMIN